MARPKMMRKRTRKAKKASSTPVQYIVVTDHDNITGVYKTKDELIKAIQNFKIDTGSYIYEARKLDVTIRQADIVYSQPTAK